MLVLNSLFKLIKLLNSEKGAISIASGFALGMVLGLVPSNPLILIGLFFFVFILRINVAAAMLAWAVFKVLAFGLDPWFDRIGYWLLTGVPTLRPFFTYLYNLPVVPWSRFNNTVVAGSLLTGFVLLVPAIFIFKFLIKRYRISVVRKIGELKIIKLWKTTKIYKLYRKYERVKGVIS